MERTIFVCLTVAFGIAAGSLLWAGDSATVTRQEIWQAVADNLRQRGLSELQLPRVEDLDMPVAAAALVGRRLRVSSSCWDEGPRRAQFRLECGEPGACLPFLVYIRSDVRRDGSAFALAGLCRPALGPRLAPEAAPKHVLQPAVRAGDRATAVFLADHLRMIASVTCLERGRQGQVIRVRSQDGHIFRARISGPGRLEALAR